MHDDRAAALPISIASFLVMILALRFSMKATNVVHDQLASGHKLRVLIMVDTFSRFSPALAPRFTFRGTDVVGGAGRGLQGSGLTGNDPRRSRQRVRVSRS
ncbi:hypothetical protein AB7M16_005037 [Bradyrhizobium sp. USDA 372]